MQIIAKKQKIQAGDIGLYALFSSNLDNLTEGEELYLDMKAKDRSLEQNRFYWDTVIPTCQYHLDLLSHCPNPKIKDDVDNAHYTLKLFYCFEQRPDLAEKVRYYCPIKKRVRTRAVPFSAKISEMSQKKFNDYLSWIQKRVNLASGLLWEDAIKNAKN